MSDLPKLDPLLVRSIRQKFGQKPNQAPDSSTNLQFDELYEPLNQAESALVKQILAIKPATIGFKGEFVTLSDPPKALTLISGQTYSEKGKKTIISDQYLPQPVWSAFKKLQKVIKADINCELMVYSGYRSPACQVLTILGWYEYENNGLGEVLKGVALPGYSQHGDPIHTAVDVINQDGLPNWEAPQNYAKTKDYEWLTKNAGRFGFRLSYPPGNPDGIIFEPWHWRYTS